MKFRSPTEQPIYMALTSGHTFVIGPDLIEVPKHFHRMAVAEGALPEGVDAMPPADQTPEATRLDLIATAMQAMIADPKDGDFMNDGRPNATRLSARCGFTVLAADRDAAWQALSDDDKA